MGYWVQIHEQKWQFYQFKIKSITKCAKKGKESTDRLIKGLNNLQLICLVWMCVNNKPLLCKVILKSEYFLIDFSGLCLLEVVLPVSLRPVRLWLQRHQRHVHRVWEGNPTGKNGPKLPSLVFLCLFSPLSLLWSSVSSSFLPFDLDVFCVFTIFFLSKRCQNPPQQSQQF